MYAIRSYYGCSHNACIFTQRVDNWIPANRILHKGRLKPGRMFLVDTEKERIVPDEEIKEEIVRARPYRKWLDENLVRLDELPAVEARKGTEPANLRQRQQTFGSYNFV